MSLAYTPSDTSARRPGVQASYESATGTLELVFGNAFSPDGEYTGSGVFFSIFALDSAGFRGWWRDGGLMAPPAEGYFCAWRTR